MSERIYYQTSDALRVTKKSHDRPSADSVLLEHGSVRVRRLRTRKAVAVTLKTWVLCVSPTIERPGSLRF